MQVTMHDQMGNKVVFNKPLLRIVSLVPSQTELLCDLGLEPNIVGITKFCVHPFQLKSTKTIVGGTKKVHYEKSVCSTPTLLSATRKRTPWKW
jgi:ABC-type Fe3+-hydroxamate transport system substrate-binding protein